MNSTFSDFVSILQSVPGRAIWLGLVIVLLPLLVTLRYARWARRLRGEALGAVFVVVIAVAVALNVKLLVFGGQERTWKQIAPAETTLFGRALTTPLNGYTFGNESLLYLNTYLRGRELVVSSNERRLWMWEDNGTNLVSAETGRELIFADITVAEYDELLTKAQAEALLRRPHFAMGVPGKNYAVFLLTPEHAEAKKVYLFTDGATFYVVPQKLAAAIGKIGAVKKQ